MRKNEQSIFESVATIIGWLFLTATLGVLVVLMIISGNLHHVLDLISKSGLLALAIVIYTMFLIIFTYHTIEAVKNIVEKYHRGFHKNDLGYLYD